MKHRFRKSIIRAGTIASVTAILVLSAQMFFPQAAQRILNWQAASLVPFQPHPAITLIHVKPQSPLACGNSDWNRTNLAQTLTTLSQSDARVLAPMLSLQGPSTMACGGAAADAALIEATAHSGRVIYPRSTFESLQQHALGVGRLPQSPEKPSNNVPFGLAIAKGYNPDIQTDFTQDAVVPSLKTESIPTEDFQTIWNRIQSQQWDQLHHHVHNKIIILTDDLSPIHLRHIHMLNAALTHTWFQPFALGSQTLITFFLSFISAGVFFMIPNKKGIITIGIVAGFSMITIFVLQWELGWILPLTGPLLALGCSTLGAGLLGFHDQKVQTSTHLATLNHTLHSLQQELRRKEEKALALSQSLKEVRLAEQESAKRLKELESTQEEIETTKQQLQKVETELIRLRAQTTETSHAPSKCSPDQETLSAECRTLGILTYDPHLLKIFSDLKKSANSSNPILLLGETGTGKEVFAQAAHRLSRRAQGPFIPVNMAAIRPELFESELFGHVKGAFTGAIGGKGYVEAAEGGTLFLDEMGELSLDLQAKLLRLLDNHTFNRVGEARTRQANVRIVAATHRDLTQDVDQGRFREDLYYRLRSIVLYLPALRERIPEDRCLLAQHFLQQFADQDTHDTYRFSQDAMNTIISYPWPGNIREMKQTLAQAVSLAQTSLLTKEDLRLGEHGSARHTRKLPGPSTHVARSKKASAWDDETILASLREHRFDMQATAQALRCDRSTLTQRLKGLGYEALVRRQGDFSLAAKDLANDETLEPLVEQKIRNYEANLFPARTPYHTAEEAIAGCRRRFKNLPDRYFPAVEMLIRHRFASGS